MSFLTNARKKALEEKAEKERSKAGKTLRRSGPHIRKARRAEEALEKIEAKEGAG